MAHMRFDIAAHVQLAQRAGGCFLVSKTKAKTTTKIIV